MVSAGGNIFNVMEANRSHIRRYSGGPVEVIDRGMYEEKHQELGRSCFLSVTRSVYQPEKKNIYREQKGGFLHITLRVGKPLTWEGRNRSMHHSKETGAGVYDDSLCR